MHTRSGTFPFIVSTEDLKSPKASPNPLARQTAVITWLICGSTRSSQVLNLARKYKEKASEVKKGGSVFSLQRYVKSACGGMQRTSHSRSRSRKKNIIVHDIDAAYGVLRDAWKWGKEDGERHIDIVLGDSSFELFADIVLACYLLSAGLATNVVLRSKAQLCHLSMIHGDISCLFNALSDPQNA